MGLEIVWIIIFFALAVSVHEFAHAYVADKLGDPTARLSGRLTINPIAHVDPIGTVLLPAILIISGSRFLFGWAKPVPVNPINLKDPKKDMIKVAIAGPIVNIAMAFVIFIALKFVSVEVPLYDGLVFGLQINLVLAIFNMIPVFPLDGSKILAGLLPYDLEYKFRQTEQYGTLILLGLIMLNITSILFAVITPIIITIFQALTFFI